MKLEKIIEEYLKEIWKEEIWNGKFENENLKYVHRKFEKENLKRDIWICKTFEKGSVLENGLYSKKAIWKLIDREFTNGPLCRIVGVVVVGEPNLKIY